MSTDLTKLIADRGWHCGNSHRVEPPEFQSGREAGFERMKKATIEMAREAARQRHMSLSTKAAEETFETAYWRGYSGRAEGEKR